VSEQVHEANDNNEQEADTSFRVVVAASFSTFLAFSMAAVLLFGVFFVCFPFSMMRISDSLGHERQALVHANRAANSRAVTGYDRTRALVRGLELSSQFLNNCDSYARQVMFFSEQFAGDENFLEQNALIDEFNFNQLRLMNLRGDDRILFLMLYCNKDFVYTQNAKARAILGQTNYFLFDGKLQSIEDIYDLRWDSLGQKIRFFNQIEIIVRYGARSYVDFFVFRGYGLPYSAQFILDNFEDLKGASYSIIQLLFYLYSINNFMGTIGIVHEFDGLDISLREFIYQQLELIN